MAMLNQAADSLARQNDDINKLNTRLQQSQRLKAIGQLTGGVAHDFNNLLTVVMGNAELLVEQSESQSTQRMLAEMILNAAQRGASLTQQLLAFARKQALSPTPIDANQLIVIYSELGLGTTVKLYLPRALGHAVAAVMPSEPVVPAGGQETIMVVEDDEMVRRYACQQLRSLGHRVIDVDNGVSALALIEQRTDFDLLFTDVVMPGGMNGRALADAARKLRPALRVLYTSGYTENAIVHHGRLDPGVLLLAKPYRLAELARAVRSALVQTSV